jgi:hypothetical protein
MASFILKHLSYRKPFKVGIMEEIEQQQACQCQMYYTILQQISKSRGFENVAIDTTTTTGTATDDQSTK